MKIAICGHSGAGKDEVSKWLSEHTNLVAGPSTSEAAMVHVFEAIHNGKLSGLYQDVPNYRIPHQCWEDRHNHRQLWRDLILMYNGPTKCRLYEEMYEKTDIFNGIRCHEELDECCDQGLFDTTIWVSRHVPKDPSNSIKPWMCEYRVNNHAGIGQLHYELLSLVTELRDVGHEIELNSGVEIHALAGR